MPNELKDFLGESNGILGRFALNAIYSTDNLIRENQSMRSLDDYVDLYMPFDNLLFIGEDGGGSYFGYSITKSGRTTDQIFCWDHETDARSDVAWGLKSYIEWYLDGFPERSH